MLVLLLLLVAGVLIGRQWLQNSDEPRIEQARIVSMTNSPGSEGQAAIVRISLADGNIREIRASREMMVQCRLGDRIEVVLRERSTEIGPRGCSVDDRERS